jgi:hypothetical protein
MIVDFLFSEKQPESPTKSSRKFTESFLGDCLKQHRAILTAIDPQWARPIFDREEFFTQRVPGYLACAIERSIFWIAKSLETMRFGAVPQGLKDHTEEIYEDIWPLAKKYLFENSWEGSITPADLENCCILVLTFLTFSFHHSLLPGDPETTASILIACPNKQALVTMPKDANTKDEILLAVPVALARPSYTFVKRL